MPAPTPLISIIVVCHNPGSLLAGALSSVGEQTIRPQVELVVIDGASTDGTPSWLAHHASQIDHWTSQPDDGIYEAMNRGIAAARGTWVYFLGADDRLATPSTLAEVSATLPPPQFAVATGTARFSDGRVYAFQGNRGAIRRNFLHHQATFYRRALFDQIGTFDASLRLQADYDFNLRVMQARQPIAPLSVLVAHCASGGASDAGKWLNYREEITVRHRHFGAAPCLLWDAVTLLRYFRKIIVRKRATNRPA